MEQQFLYFLQHLNEIDQKYFHNQYSSNLRYERSTFIQLITYGCLYIEWNKDSRPKLEALRQELLLTGLQVGEIEELQYAIKLIVRLPKSPSRELLYGQN